MTDELDVKEELDLERQENESLTIKEIKTLEKILEKDKELIYENSLGAGLTIVMLAAIGLIFDPAVRRIIHFTLLGFGIGRFFTNILPHIKDFNKYSAIKAEKEEEIEELRKR